MFKLRKSRLLRLIPSLIVICLFSLSAQAKYGGGTGEPNDPYLIYIAEQMNEIGLHEEDWDKNFKLMADVDLAAYTGMTFNIIGCVDDRCSWTSFTGVFRWLWSYHFEFHLSLYKNTCHRTLWICR